MNDKDKYRTAALGTYMGDPILMETTILGAPTEWLHLMQQLTTWTNIMRSVGGILYQIYPRKSRTIILAIINLNPM